MLLFAGWKKSGGSTRRINPVNLLCNLVFQRLACLEYGDSCGGNFNSFLGSGVAAHASFASLGLKAAKADQLNLVTSSQSVGDGIDGCVNGLFGVFLGNAAFLGDFIDELGLVHDSSSFHVK